ncbi:MAG TPA: hypothetical protein VHS99_23450 [Chloroflexota bacterium]|nr:hypothetical protein [Chloroflexota bacterium]
MKNPQLRPDHARRRFLAASAAALVAAPVGAACTARSVRAPLGLGAPAIPDLPGRLLYVGDADIWVWQQGRAQRLTQDRISRQPVWSPDGRRIAHIKLDVSSSELWVMDADSANSRQLTRNYNPTLTLNNWAFRPLWWPDGSRLLYLSEEMSQQLMLWQVTLDGRQRRRFLTVQDAEGGLDMPSLSPDARQLAVVTYRGPKGVPQVWTYTVPNGPWRQLTESEEGAYDPSWSPDGKRLAYTRRRAGRHDVWVMNADGTDGQPVTGSGTARAPCWSPDGQWLAFIAAESGDFELWVTRAPAAGAPVPVQRATGDGVSSGAARTPGPAATPAETRGAAPAGLPAAYQLTRGAALDAVSGLSWAA